MSGIDREAWLKALDLAESQMDDPDALTYGQIEDLFKMGHSGAWLRMQKLLKAGQAKQVKVKRQDPSGKWRVYTAFVLTPTATPPKRPHR